MVLWSTMAAIIVFVAVDMWVSFFFAQNGCDVSLNFEFIIISIF